MVEFLKNSPEVGSDNWYPMFVARFTPENMAANIEAL